MAQFPVLKARGVHVSDNQLSAVPEGGLVNATNCVIQSRDIIESRRGQPYVAGSFGASNLRSDAGACFEDYALFHYTDTLGKFDFGSESYSAFPGTLNPPDPQQQRMKFVEMALGIYFTTTLGPFRLDSTPALAGVPKALDIPPAAAGVTGNPDSGWMPDDAQVAYRALLGIKDSNNIIKLGAPSGRCVVTNPAAVVVGIGNQTRDTVPSPDLVTATVTSSPFLAGSGAIVMNMQPGEANFAAGNKTISPASATTFTYQENGASVFSTASQTFTSGSKDITLTVPLPADATVSHFIRLYRSYASASAGASPEDELFQVYEAQLTSTDITNKYVTVTDRTPELMLGGPLYTNPNTGDTILAAKERPPLCNDMCEWQGRMWFANTTNRQRFFLSLLGASAPDGLQNNDTITVAGRTYTAKATPAAATDFQLQTFSESAAINVEMSARALAKCINDDASNTTVYAYYVSGENDTPGKLLIEARSLDVSAFSVYASRIASWSPALTTGSSGAATSTGDRRRNGLSYSPQQEPESAPLVNYLTVGPANVEILRIVPLREKLFVFPERGGIYTVSGEFPFRVDLLDSTATLVAPDTAVPHSNAILCLSSQGAVQVSDAGVRILSSPIESELIPLINGELLPVTARRAFAFSYESERQWQLWVPQTTDDNCATKAWVYNSLRDVWVPWEGERTWGGILPETGVAVYGDGSANKLRAENKAFDRTDYVDEVLAVTIASSSGYDVVLSSAAGITAGDMLYVDEATKSVIEEVDEDTNTVTVATTEVWPAGAASVLVAIDCELKWTPAMPSPPGVEKRYREDALHFRNLAVVSATAVYDSERSDTEVEVEFQRLGFGQESWGSVPFGTPNLARNKRVGVPPQHQRSTQIRTGLRIREARAIWRLQGHTLEYELGSERSVDRGV